MSRSLSLLVALSLLLAACGGGGDAPDEAKGDGTLTRSTEGYTAMVASYEPVAERPQRFIVGFTAPEGRLVSFGQVDLAFSYLGTRDEPLDPAEPGPSTTGTWIPVPGQDVSAGEREPRVVKPSEGVGVYRAEDVVFDRPGFWEVVATTELGGGKVTMAAPFEVKATPQVPFPGEPAPRTRNPVWGASDVPPKAIDSRAEPGGADPAPELHSTVIADAIAAGRPLVVTVSTPVYCQSRFCGPITDMVQELATEYGDRMAFVHLEVFRDFDEFQLNPFAEEWIRPRDGGELREPWTFLVGPDGTIADRWDNVATEAEVEEAIRRVLGAGA